jgi:uncharacterized repeat protein (TIGR03803 family)
MNIRRSLKKVCAVFVLCAATAIASPAQTFKTLVSFNGSNGSFPHFVSLSQGADGHLYGTTAGGTLSFPGTIFNVTTEGTVTTLGTFCGSCQSGDSPWTGLVLDTDGNFYGTTAGNFDDDGTVFKFHARSPLTSLTTLHRFHGNDGRDPFAALLLAVDGNIYGTTFYGGTSSSCSFGCGTVFKITPEGTLSTLHTFDYADGGGPVGALIQGTDGNVYGTTSFGGANGYGTVFRMTSMGTLTTLHDFDSTDGASPYGGLVQATDGNLYGTTSGGGGGGNGTVFKITAGGRLTSLYSFCAGECADGATPYAGLIQATDGNFYGTTYANGAYFGGTVFKITPGGDLTTLYSFCARTSCIDGARPYGGLVQSTNGILYGITYEGGGFDEGVVFTLDVGLGPFVTFVRAAGRVDQTGPILGQGLTGTTSVAINGIPGVFTVISDTVIRATVPAGATTGYVTVTTPTGVLTSNVPFHVIQ